MTLRLPDWRHLSVALLASLTGITGVAGLVVDSSPGSAAPVGPTAGPLVPASPVPASPTTVASTPEPTGDEHGAAAANEQFGDATFRGSMAGKALAQPIVDMAATASGGGYWLVARDGGVFTFGDAAFRGSTGGIRLAQPIVGMERTGTGAGYWVVAADGGVFTFGDAAFRGSLGAVRLAQPIVDLARTPSGAGYWMVAADGGVFTFGDARFLGSGAGRLSTPVVEMRATPSGRGYWLLAADGRVLSFGDAAPLGSAAGRTSAPLAGLATTPSGRGYWLASIEGPVLPFGDAPAYAPSSVGSPVVAITPTPTGQGYWLATAAGGVLSKAVVQTTGTYGYLATDRSGNGMRYNPCAPVRYVINPDGAPAGMIAEVHDGFRRLGAATGIDYAFAGTTTETHLPIGGDARRRSYQPERYGTEWAPILISWSTPAVEPILTGSVLGYGGSTSYWLSSTDQAYVTGEAVFDRDVSVLRPGFGAGLTRGNLIVHEIAHVAGLDHVQDRGELMHSSLSSRTPDGFGPGDRTGLALLGAPSGCLRVASPPRA